MSYENGRVKRRSLAIGVCTAGIAVLLLAGIWFWPRQAFIPGDPSDRDQVAFGSRVYGRICANCHGTGLDGQLGWQQPLKDGTRLAPAHNTDGQTWRYSDEALFEVVKFGGDYDKPDGGISRMPAFENKLTDDEIWSIIAFIKSHWPTEVLEAQQSVTTAKP
ncbi:MAG: c-type cytochrome [Geminicoccaceae bacterium]